MTFSHPQQGGIDFNTVNPSLSRGMDFLIHPCRWVDDEENVRTPPKRGRYWEIHPRRPRDFPRPERFPEGEARGKSRGSREISRAEGVGFPNTSQVLVECGHSPHHQFIYRDGSGNPSLWAGKDWQCKNQSFPAEDERMEHTSFRHS